MRCEHWDEHLHIGYCSARRISCLVEKNGGADNIISYTIAVPYEKETTIYYCDGELPDSEIRKKKDSNLTKMKDLGCGIND